MKTGEIVVCAVGAGLVMLGLLIAYATVRMYRKNRYAHGWPKVTGTIVASDLDVNLIYRNDKSVRTYGAAIRYSYFVGGKAYESDQIQLGGRSETSEPEEYEKAVARYPAGKRVTVYYDPGDPATATLEPGATGGIRNMAFVGGGFVLVGAVLMTLTLRGGL